jgi:hypothetical protein
MPAGPTDPRPSLPGGTILVNAPRLGVRNWEAVPPELKPSAVEPKADPAELERFAQEQLARDIADIERASIALRRAAPALQNWSKPTTPSNPRQLSVWYLVGALWLLTAVVTAGAVIAIASLSR